MFARSTWRLITCPLMEMMLALMQVGGMSMHRPRLAGQDKVGMERIHAIAPFTFRV